MQLEKLDPQQHLPSRPRAHTEASLVKELEKQGMAALHLRIDYFDYPRSAT